ncbi:MAG: hypothetical protein MUF21_09990 [Gemmatimonadaceae bacterium]|jgi:hypothetical protein|nr:hypothetical protein [Gemmatimonadaceae bacterium]
MSITEVFDDYVGDVVRRLPAGLRDDVGAELRALLDDALAERVAATAMPADDAMALAVLGEFGVPARLAARYQPERAPIIPADETTAFLRLALGGVALQWLLTLPTALARGTLGAWWLSWGLGAFWWPGVLVVGAAVRSWWRGRPRAARPPPVDREAVAPRPTLVGVWVAIAAAAIVLLMPLWRTLLPAAGAQAFALAPDFIRGRGLVVIPLWALTIALHVRAMRTGRWTRALRRWRLATELLVVLLLAWWSTGPRLFVLASTDALVRQLLQLIALLVLLDLAVRWLRRGHRVASPRSGR